MFVQTELHFIWIPTDAYKWASERGIEFTKFTNRPLVNRNTYIHTYYYTYTVYSIHIPHHAGLPPPRAPSPYPPRMYISRCSLAVKACYTHIYVIIYRANNARTCKCTFSSVFLLVDDTVLCSSLGRINGESSDVKRPKTCSCISARHNIENERAVCLIERTKSIKTKTRERKERKERGREGKEKSNAKAIPVLRKRAMFGNDDPSTYVSFQESFASKSRVTIGEPVESKLQSFSRRSRTPLFS